MSKKETVVFVSGKRTPFGAYGGVFRDLSATDLTERAARATLVQNGCPLGVVDQIVIGNVVSSGADGAYLPRHVGLRIGIPPQVGAYMVNRLCGSGFQSWIEAAQLIQGGSAQVVLAGGVEQMSQIPYVVRNARWGARMGNMPLEDLMTAALTDAHVGLPMAMTAENLAADYKIRKEESDAYSYQSQVRYQKGLREGAFDREIEPIQIESKKGLVTFSKDEHPRSDASPEKIASMKPLFKKDGVVTAASASGIVDGAVCSLLMGAARAHELGLKPIAKMLGWAAVGCDPKIMGIGPVAAVQKVLSQLDLGLKDMDLIEVNEAFAAQYLAVEKALKLDRDRTNQMGGAIAIGHPLGATGARIMNHLAYELERTHGRYAIGSACIGGGQGIAIVLERA